MNGAHSELLGRITAALGHEPASVLWLNPHSSKASGNSVRSQVTFARQIPPDGAPWDAIVLDGVLERERWDRWLLQRIHRALAPGGVLLIEAPNLLAVWSPAGIGYIASRGLRQLGRRLVPRSAIHVADRSRFQGRRYMARALAGVVEGVGFEVLTVGSGRVIEIVARRQPSLWGEGRPFPACDIVRKSFWERHADAITRRDHGPRGSSSNRRVESFEISGAKSAVVFSPHPDDEVIGCGGTLLDLAAAGAAVTIVQVTDGSDSAAFIDEPEDVRRTVRLTEASAVAARIGAELVCLAADNRSLRATPELRARFRELLLRARPGFVFAPSFTDTHPDHQVVLQLVADALTDLPEPRPDVALYEVWSLVAPTHMHVVDARMGEIEDMLLLYDTALKIDDYVHLVMERLLYNSCEYRRRSGYVEVFDVLPAREFLEIAARSAETARHNA